MQPTVASRTVSRDELLQCIQECQLLSPADLDKIQNTPSFSGLDGMALACALSSHNLLTSYQVEALCQRRFHELRIGNYDVLDRLGAGGMGTVYKARHRRMKRLVAIKVLLRSLCQESSFVQRFQREVETVARLSHPNIVLAYDADEAEVGHFLVMEFVEGRDLASRVEQQGPFALRQAVNCILQAARGLESAHSQNIIHRDIKPANLLLDIHGVVKVADLGLARLSNVMDRAASTSGITQAGGILGTVDFMPPEQALDSTTIDHRADIYSLGCTLYFLLTGQVLYPADSLMKALLKHRDAPIPSLKASRPDVPAPLEDLYRRMVAKAPADRPATMTEVVKALEAIETTLDDSASVSVQVGTPAGAPGTTPSSGQTVDLKPPGTQHDNLLSVLLVEPSRTQAVIIRKYLQNLGLEPAATVAAGQAALEALRQTVPTVIVSAMYLQDMTGVQLAQRVQAEHGGQTPGFVLISSEAESQAVGSLSKAGKATVLHKPFTLEQMAEALSVVSGQKVEVQPSSAGAAGQPLDKLGKIAGQNAPLASVPNARARIKVLLVDDSAAARSWVREVIGHLGFSTIVEAADGAQAVAAVARETFDLVITDYNMPFMDGQGLVGFLRQHGSSANVPIILVTTEKDPAKLEAVRRLGVTAICEKSFQPEVVKEIFDRLFPLTPA
jgi:serine/threonine protein kinase